MLSALSQITDVGPFTQNLPHTVGLAEQSWSLMQGTGSTSPFALTAPRGGLWVRTTMPIAIRTACGAPPPTCRAPPMAAAAPPHMSRCMVRRWALSLLFLCRCRQKCVLKMAGNVVVHLLEIVVRAARAVTLDPLAAKLSVSTGMKRGGLSSRQCAKRERSPDIPQSASGRPTGVLGGLWRRSRNLPGSRAAAAGHAVCKRPLLLRRPPVAAPPLRAAAIPSRPPAAASQCALATRSGTPLPSCPLRSRASPTLLYQAPVCSWCF